MIKKGTFLYDGMVECDLLISHSAVRYGSGDDEDPPGVRDDVSADTYYIWYGSTTERGAYSAGGGGFGSLQEAVSAAERSAGVGCTVKWNR